MNSHPVRIALIGKSGAGKSEAARVFSKELSCAEIKTGKLCREIAQLLFGNDDKNSTQILDDALTKIDESIFLRASIRDLDVGESCVIDSLRFISDLEVAKNLNCQLVRVTTSDERRIARLKLRGQKFNINRDGLHRSETDLDLVEVHKTIINEGSINEFREKVRTFARSFK